jgi:hypothetical protein
MLQPEHVTAEGAYCHESNQAPWLSEGLQRKLTDQLLRKMSHKAILDDNLREHHLEYAHKHAISIKEAQRRMTVRL